MGSRKRGRQREAAGERASAGDRRRRARGCPPDPGGGDRIAARCSANGEPKRALTLDGRRQPREGWAGESGTV